MNKEELKQELLKFAEYLDRTLGEIPIYESEIDEYLDEYLSEIK